MKSVFTDEKGKEKFTASGQVPKEFTIAAGNFVNVLRDELNANEIRTLAASKVASPVLQVNTISQNTRHMALSCSCS